MRYLTIVCSELNAKPASFLLSDDDCEAIAMEAKENGFICEDGTGDVGMLLRAIARGFFAIVPNRIQDINDESFALDYEEWIEYCKGGEAAIIERGIENSNPIFPEILKAMYTGGSIENAIRVARDVQ